MIQTTLHQWLEHWVKVQPYGEFLIYPDRSLRLTYDDFKARVDRFAKGLLHIGVRRGDKVGLWAKNIPDWLTVMFASSKIGAVVVPINTNYKLTEVEYVMLNADIHTMCIMNGYRDTDYISTINEIVPEFRTTQRGFLRCERLPELRNVVYLGAEKHRGMYNSSELNILGAQSTDERLKEVEAKTSCHDIVYMPYTSGSSGEPKGVMLSHFNIMNNGKSIGDSLAYTNRDKLLMCVPFFHTFGSVLGLCAVITHGSSMVVLEDFNALTVLSAIQKEKCTALYGVPTMFVAELNHPMIELFDLSSLRTGIMAGAPCPIEYMKRVVETMNCRDIIIVYGLTESSPAMTATTTKDSLVRRCETVGRALADVEVAVLNPLTGEKCAVGEVGEMCCRGYNVMQGYYKNEEATSAIIDSNGYLHSGDLGTIDSEGYFRITGRIKDIIIRGGENIYPTEIENLLLTHPAIQRAQVAGLPSPKFGEQVAAYIILSEGEDITEHDIISFCTGKIARYKIPKYILLVKSFPLSAAGEVQKHLLKDIGLEILTASGITIE